MKTYEQMAAIIFKDVWPKDVSTDVFVEGFVKFEKQKNPNFDEDAFRKELNAK